MKKAVDMKKIKTNKGDVTMKNSKRFSKVMAALLALVMCMSLFIGAIPASAASYDTTSVPSYVPDYSGNDGNYNGQFIYQENNNRGFYGNYNNGTYYDAYGNYYSANNYSPDQWFNTQYGNRFKFYWIKSPQAPSIRGDFFRAVYDFEMAHARNYNSNYNSYNNYYQMNNSTNFVDYWKYQNYSRMISILHSTGGYNGINILDGRDINGQYYLDFDSCITRAEAAKLLVQTNSVWWQISQKRNPIDFADCFEHWARYQISSAYALAFVNGTGYNNFSPDYSMTNQEMLTMFCNVMDNSRKYSIYDFINMVNASDVARIVEVNWDNDDNINAIRSWKFYPDKADMYVGDSFDLTSIISNYNSNIRFSVNSNKAYINGHTLYATEVGVVTVTGTDGNKSDTATITIKDRNSNLSTPEPQRNLLFTEGTITMQKGTSQDFASKIKNAVGNAYISSANSYYVSTNGTMVYANEVTRVDEPIQITVTDERGQTATAYVKVVDNNAKEDLNIEVDYSDYNPDTGVISVMVRNVPSGYTVLMNDNDYTSEHVEVQNVGLAGMVKLHVTGLYGTGGRDALIVCVYNQSGIKVWEDTKGSYCPQMNAYTRDINW